jgi:hypothetical protein
MEAIKHSQENNVDLIQKIRNDLVKDFLDERYLKEYLAEHYHVRELSNVKVEFIKKELKDLLQVPLDTKHYDALLTRLNETDATTLSDRGMNNCSSPRLKRYFGSTSDRQ